MSGEVALLGDPQGKLEELVQAVVHFERVGLAVPYALVGGLAVTARLATRHRPTFDVDTVYVESEIDVVQVLVDNGAERQGDGVVLPQGVKLDLIAVGYLDPAGLPVDPRQRAFVLSHRWALDSADAMTLQVIDEAGGVTVQVQAPVASASALVATKLQSTLSRREALRHKRASDVFDLYRLLDVHDADGGVSTAFADAPKDLAALSREFATQLLVDEAERSVRWMRAGGGPEMQEIEPADLRAVGEPFVGRLAHVPGN